MIGSISKALTVVAGLAVLASVAMAGVPDATMSTTDGDFMIGNARGLAIIAGQPNVRATLSNGYEVVVNDVTGTPIAGATVTMQFAGSNLQVHSGQSGSQVANCGSNFISLVTDVNGRVIFFPAVAGQNNFAGSNVQVRANGVLLTTIRFHSMDLVRVGGGGAGLIDVDDLNAFRLRFLGQGGHTVLDPDCDFATETASANIVDSADLNLFRTEFLCGQPGGAPAPCTKTECP
jgi:hypothetical protein